MKNYLLVSEADVDAAQNAARTVYVSKRQQATITKPAS
jgi:hypothetical protein